MSVNNVIITSYYLTIPDPQRNKYYKEDFNYIKKFYDSIIKFDLKCIIFHDGLSSDFLETYKTNNIYFIKFNHDDYITNSGNDTRNLVFLKHLEHNLYDNIIISDISGVEYLSDPFKDINKNKVYVATSRRKNKNGQKRDLTHPWFKDYAIRAYGNFDLFEKFKNKYTLTCKFFGGNYKLIFEILTEFKNEFQKVNLNYNTNYAVFNYIMYSKFQERMIQGYSTHDGYEETIYPDKNYIINIRNANVYGKLFWDM